ncbi:hypothetical protein EDD15DRAFT_2362419 [Pisolithus albus]|nr:hypothetical protein EDD15DRAFT_2362419 [Pisolithus albus]
MNKQSVHVSKHETVSTSQADEIELVNPILPTVKHMPHVLRLQVPTSIEYVTLSFEPKSRGPVTIEIPFTTASPELMDVADPSHMTTTTTTSAHDSVDARANGIEPEFVDLGLPALVQSANEQPTLPCIPVVHDAEPGERTPSPFELTVVLELSPSPLPTHTPYRSLKRAAPTGRLESWYESYEAVLYSLSHLAHHPRFFPSVNTFSEDGVEVQFQHKKLLEDDHTCLIYLVETVEACPKKIVVKFVTRYDFDAHLTMADAGFAPKLRYFGQIDTTERRSDTES